MTSDRNRITALEVIINSTIPRIEEYMREGREWRDETSERLTIVINQQANYQETCESDREENKDDIEGVDARVKKLELVSSRQSGMAVIISALIGAICGGLTAIAAAFVGRT